MDQLSVGVKRGRTSGVIAAILRFMTDPVLYTSIVRRPCPRLPPPPPKSSLESAPGAERRPWDPRFLPGRSSEAVYFRSMMAGGVERAVMGVMREDGSRAAGSSLLNGKIE